MILSALANYYDSRCQESDSAMPLSGFSRQKIHFALSLDPDGNLAQVLDLRSHEGKKLAAVELIVPEVVKRASGIAANFLWDNTGYVLGADDKGKPERSAKTFAAFKALCHEIGDGLDDAGLTAVLRFLDAWDPAKAPELKNWEEMVKAANIVFRLEGELAYVHDRPAVREAWLRYKQSETDGPRGMCLVTGQDAAIARLHPSIKGVRDAQSSGASLVSFNQESFTSYGKEQSYNAPVGEPAAFAYTTALNHLLRKGSRQRLQIGDATTVFWTEKPSKVETFMGMALDPSAGDGLTDELRLFLEAIRDGKKPDAINESEYENGFYVLGLAPNASRLSVRFWHRDTVAGVCDTVGRHFADLAIERTWGNEPEFPGLWQLLRETALQNDLKNVNPALAGALARAMLTGQPYPASLPAAVIGRIRADQTVNYLRAAMLKAFLVRNTTKEVSVSLNPTSTDIGYRLGRLFAVLEKVQQEAIPGANTTIRDRYYGSASATPAAVFPQLMRLAQHHIDKAEYGLVSDRRIEEILEAIQAFPKHLSLDEQGMFAIGYYHQRRENYKKTAKTEGEA